jgi:5-methylcytosine-specific restriction endonuclease McrA
MAPYTKEERRAYNLEYQAKNKDKIRARRKEYYDKNRKQIIEKVVIWQKANAEQANQRQRRWRKLNTERAKELSRKKEQTRRQRKANWAGITKIQLEKIFLAYGNKCLSCGATENIEIDHVVPLCAGGAHLPDNLQLLCHKCNLQKARKTIDYRADCGVWARYAFKGASPLVTTPATHLPLVLMHKSYRPGTGSSLRMSPVLRLSH